MKNRDIRCIVLFLQNEIIYESKRMYGYRQQMLVVLKLSNNFSLALFHANFCIKVVY
jgi:hypothetical protein